MGCPTQAELFRLQHSRAFPLVSFQIAIQQSRRRGDLSGHLRAMHVFVPPHAHSCTAGRVSRMNTALLTRCKKPKKEEHLRALLKLAASQVVQEERRAANRAVKVFALQRGFALDYCRESTPALVAPKLASEQPRQAGLPDRVQSIVCRAASLSTGLNRKSAPSSGVFCVPDVSPQERGADRTPEVRLQSWYDAGSCQLPANLNTAIVCLQA